MLKKIAVALAAAGGLMVATAPAHAGGHVSLSIGLGVPIGGVVGYAPPPVYYAPPVQYYDPPPVVYAPPVIYAPQPRYYAPPVVYGPAPAYYGARVGWRDGWAPGYGHHRHDHDGWRGRDEWRDHDRRGDRDGWHR